MRLRALAVLAFPAALLLIACPAKDMPPPTPPAVEVRLTPNTDGTSAEQLGVVPKSPHVPSAAHEIVWTSSDPGDQILIEFIGQTPPPDPAPGTGTLRHQPNWPVGQYKGNQPYRATVTRSGRTYVNDSPELIIDF